MIAFIFLFLLGFVYFYSMRMLKNKIEKEDAEIQRINAAIHRREAGSNYARKTEDNNVFN